jgi:hypothetical protein
MLLIPKDATALLCYDLPATGIVENVYAVPECRNSFSCMDTAAKVGISP